ncbi:hypothetical protein Asd1617_01274 [Shigella dysenteriae 1617]|uniref:Uncharacterized protein n=1 Tax=Shigella dysenteriae 1617 TaxID=754093 RepID=A0A0A6ZR61_SHIDY|nr:hypothetical protein Asd1617_01274 [Shigella dysenteriae 1617]
MFFSSLTLMRPVSRALNAASTKHMFTNWKHHPAFTA